MDCEVALVFAGGAGDDEAEESFSDVGEVVVVLHAVGRQGGSVDGDAEVVLNIEGVHARAVEGDCEDIVADGSLGNVLDDAPRSGIDLVDENPSDVIRC